MINSISVALLFIIQIGVFAPALSYPIDGYITTGIRRLLYLQLVENEEIKKRKLIPGALKSTAEIQLQLYDNPKGDSLSELPQTNKLLQRRLNALFPNLDESYSWALLEITDGKPLRYAERKSHHQFQPGSVGKLAVITGLFSALAKIYPGCFEARLELLRNKKVRAGSWVIHDEHTIPIFDTLTRTLTKRQVKESDVFTLYEWTDHMMSVSNNGAASVVWREVILMNVFGSGYSHISDEVANGYFNNTPRAELAEIGRAVVNNPLQELGITQEEWRLGSFFTRGATRIVPRKGGSTGSPKGLMKWMVALERGVITDPLSSLEIKRLMYMTGRRIRYASAGCLRSASVYFKSGSLYKCDRDLNPDCGKYRGNVINYMNSIVIIEHEDCTTYLVALMSNVLNKNSASDHNALAASIDRVVRKT